MPEILYAPGAQIPTSPGTEESFGPSLGLWEGVCEYRSSAAMNFGPGGASVVRIYDVPWANFPQWSREMLGYPFVSADGMRRHLPDVEPEFPGLFCTRLSKPNSPELFAGQSGVSSQLPLATARFARVAVTYESLPYAVKTKATITLRPKELGRYTVKRVEGSGEYLASQWGELLFDDDTNTQVSSRIGVWQPSSMVTYEIFDFHPDAWTPERVQDKLVGRINSDVFDDYAPGRLLFLSMKYDFINSPLGEKLNKIALTFYHKPSGHNKAPKPGTGIQTLMKYKAPDLDGNPRRPLQSVDFGEYILTTALDPYPDPSA